jgi:WD40 repeat protein
MKHRKRLGPALSIGLIALLLAGCTFTVEVLSTPASTLPPIEPSVTPTSTAITPTPFLSTATPTLIPIRTDTLPMLAIFTNLGEGELLRSVAITPDNGTVVTGGGNAEDFAIHIWDVASGQSLGTLNGHTGIIWALAFSPDGQMLVSVSSDKTAKIWDWHNKTLLQSLDFPGEVVSVNFSPDGQVLAVGGVDEVQNDVSNAAIWTFAVSSWKPLLKFHEYMNTLAMTFSPDGRWLVGGGTSRNVQVWRTSDGTSVYTLNHAHQVLDIAISPDSSTAATATCITTVNSDCTEGGVWLWDLTTGRLLNKLRGFSNVVENVAFSADGTSLITASRDGTLRTYSTADYSPTFEANPPGGNGVLALSPDSGLLATGGPHGEVRLWKVVYRP